MLHCLIIGKSCNELGWMSLLISPDASFSQIANICSLLPCYNSKNSRINAWISIFPVWESRLGYLTKSCIFVPVKKMTYLAEAKICHSDNWLLSWNVFFFSMFKRTMRKCELRSAAIVTVTWPRQAGAGVKAGGWETWEFHSYFTAAADNWL